MRGEIRRNLFPRHALVARAMQVLRSVIKHFRIVRRRGHRRNSLKTKDQITRWISVQRLRADPVVLLLARLQIHHTVLPFARSVNDCRIFRIRHNWTGLASRPRSPIFTALRVRLARNYDRRVVLLRAVKFVRKLIVKPDAINFARRLIQLS